MSQNVMITGAGKAIGLGFNMVLRYLEAGDNVVATVRKPCAELEELKTKYGNKLTILTMDIGRPTPYPYEYYLRKPILRTISVENCILKGLEQ